MTEFAKVAEVKAGDVLITDGGFDCMAANKRKVVHEDDQGLYIDCNKGQHYLDGQREMGDAEDNDYYSGLVKAS